MPDSHDRFTIAIDLAERTIGAEARVFAFKNERAPAAIIEQAIEIFGRCMGEIAKNELAESLLSQARVIVHARDNRRRYIHRRTLLGKLAAKTDDLCMDLSSTPEVSSTGFEDNEDASQIDELMSAISNVERYRIAFWLHQSLGMMIEDLIYESELNLLIHFRTRIETLCSRTSFKEEPVARNQEQEHLVNAIVNGSGSTIAMTLYDALDSIIVELEELKTLIPLVPENYMVAG